MSAFALVASNSSFNSLRPPLSAPLLPPLLQLVQTLSLPRSRGQRYARLGRGRIQFLREYWRLFISVRPLTPPAPVCITSSPFAVFAFSQSSLNHILLSTLFTVASCAPFLWPTLSSGPSIFSLSPSVIPVLYLNPTLCGLADGV